MSTPVRTTWIQANAAALLEKYQVTPDLRVFTKTTKRESLPRKTGAGGGVVSVNVKGSRPSSQPYNRLRWFLHFGTLPEQAVYLTEDGSLECLGVLLKKSGVSDVGQFMAPVGIPGATRTATDAELLRQYDELVAEFKHRGIDPVRRVRIITTVTEVPL